VFKVAFTRLVDATAANQQEMLRATQAQLLEDRKAELGREAERLKAELSATLHLHRELKAKCYAVFVQFHTIISSVTAENIAVQGDPWHDAYRTKIQQLEPVGDELIALTHVTISRELAEDVKKLRLAFRMWEASWMTSQASAMPSDLRSEAFRKALEDHPREILGLLDGVTKAYGVELRRAMP
jgi:hypothetical protein